MLSLYKKMRDLRLVRRGGGTGRREEGRTIGDGLGRGRGEDRYPLGRGVSEDTCQRGHLSSTVAVPFPLCFRCLSVLSTDFSLCFANAGHGRSAASSLPLLVGISIGAEGGCQQNSTHAAVRLPLPLTQAGVSIGI